MRRILAVSLLVTLVALAGCGSSGSSSSSSGSPGAGGAAQTSGAGHTSLAKTKFVFHVGLAFGAFHRYIYKPLKNHSFTGAGGLRKASILIKGALAAAFTYHELKLAAHDAQSSPTLRKLVSPLTALATRIQGLGPGIRRGQASSSEVDGANSQISTIGSQSKQAGQPINERNPPASLQPVS